MLFAISRASDWDGLGQPCEGAVLACTAKDEDGNLYRNGWVIRIPKVKIMDFVARVGRIVIYPPKSEKSLRFVESRDISPEQRAYEKLQCIVIYDDYLE